MKDWKIFQSQLPMAIIKRLQNRIPEFHLSQFRISKKILKQLVEIYRKIRNTSRFILGNLYDFDPDTNNVSYDKLDEIDKLILSQFQDLIKRTTENYDNYVFHTLYYDIHNFCTLNLSSFYLDMIKDRLYVLNADSLQRRAAQTVLYRIISELTRLIAPVLSFSAEEIWQNLNKISQKEESVFLSPWPQVEQKLVRIDLEEEWSKLLAVRKVVLKALEISRKEGQIGNALQAQVDIYSKDEKVYNYLQKFNGKLETVFIVSKVKLMNNNDYNANENVFKGEEVPEISILIKKAPGQKCERCWCYSETIGEDNQHPTICHKCVSVLKEGSRE